MTALAREQAVPQSSIRSSAWWLLAGLLALYVPTYVDLYDTFWKSGRAVQGPVILAWIAWLVWRDRARLVLSSDAPVAPAAVVLFVVGLLCYALGRSQSFFQLEIGSQLPLLYGLVWATMARDGLRRLA